MSSTHYLYTIRPTRWEMLTDGGTEAETEILSRHFAYLQALTAQGKVFLAGRTLTTDPQSMGIVIINTVDEEEAVALMQADPAVAEGVMTAVLSPFRIALLAGSQ